MAFLALMLLSALPPAAERFPWRAEVSLVAAEVNGVRAYWGGAVIAEAPAAALRRLRAVYGDDELLVVEAEDQTLFWHAAGMRGPGKGLLAALRRYGGPLALRVSARTGSPVASQAVWLADTACSLKLVKPKLCIPADMDALAAIMAAAIPAVDLQVVTLSPENEGTRITWIFLPGASAGPLLALLHGGGTELCKRIPFPHPRPDGCLLVVRLADGTHERSVALLAFRGDVELRHAERALRSAGWTANSPPVGALPVGSPPFGPRRGTQSEEPESLYYQHNAAQVVVQRIRRGDDTYFVYLGRRQP